MAKTSSHASQKELSFTKNPNLHFIFGSRALEPASPQPQTVPVISIDLHAAENSQIPPTEVAIAESEEDADDLSALKQQLNARALELSSSHLPIPIASTPKAESIAEVKQKVPKDDSSPDRTAKEDPKTAATNVSMLERALRRLCESREHLSRFKDISTNFTEVTAVCTMDDGERLRQCCALVSQLQAAAQRISLDPLEQDITYFRSMISRRGFPESTMTACTAFETPKVPEEKQNHAKYYSQISRLRAENALLQAQMGKLENTFAAISGNVPPIVPERPASAVRPAREELKKKSLNEEPLKRRSLKEVFCALTILSRQKQTALQLQAGEKLELARQETDIARRADERSRKVATETERRYKELWAKYQQRADELAELRQLLGAKMRKISQLTEVIGVKVVQLGTAERELLASKELVGRLAPESKENRVPDEFGKRVKAGLGETLAPVLSTLKQIHDDMKMYREALAISVERNESAQLLFRKFFDVTLRLNKE